MNTHTLRRFEAQLVAKGSLPASSKLRPWTCLTCLSRVERRMHGARYTTAQPPNDESVIHTEPIRSRSGPKWFSEAPLLRNKSRQLDSRISGSAHEPPFLLKKATARAPTIEQSQTEFQISSAIKQKDIWRLLDGLKHASKEDPTYLQNIPPPTWTEMLYLLDWRAFGPDLHRSHRKFNASRLGRIGYDERSKRRDYFHAINAYLEIRRTHSINLSLVDYRILLRNVATAGDITTARTVWWNMERDGIRPDVDCYNYYMESIVYNENSRLEQKARAKDTKSGYRPRLNDIMLFKAGTSQEVRQLFTDMIRLKKPPNKRTFLILITALAHDGDVGAIKEVVKKAWGLDVDKLALESEADVRDEENAASFTPDSDLLRVCTTAFGSTGNVPMALSLVDYMWQEYSIKPDDHTWYALILWTWLQARIRPARSNSQPALVLTPVLFKKMMDEPYSVKPSMDILDIVLSTASSSQPSLRKEMTNDFVLSLLEVGRTNYLQIIRSYKEALYQLHTARQQLQSHRRRVGPGSLQPSLAALQTRLEKIFIKKRQYHEHLQRWVRRLLSQHPEYSASKPVDAEQEWRLRQLPALLWQYRTFVPSLVNYPGVSGHIEMTFRTPAEAANNRARKLENDAQHRMAWRDP